jgi:DedD protein
MATTVVSVVIFLCGVLVGRGVRGETLSAAASTSPPAAASGPTASTPASTPSEAPPADNTLSYKDRLESEKPAVENLKTAKAEPAPAPVAVVTPPPPVDAPPAAAQPEAMVAKHPEAKQSDKDKTPEGTTGASDPSAKKSGIWAVQVVALTDQAAANAVVQRLSSKGYPAFLVRPQPTSPVQNYKVQVGKFDDRTQAEQVAGRLKREEQFQPWILR